MNVVADLGIAGAAAVVALLVGFYLVIYLRNRREGWRGLVQRSRLSCPKCRRSFECEYLPGASFTAVRLGTGRYMACPLCHKWSRFNLAATRRPIPPRAGE